MLYFHGLSCRDIDNFFDINDLKASEKKAKALSEQRERARARKAKNQSSMGAKKTRGNTTLKRKCSSSVQSRRARRRVVAEDSSDLEEVPLSDKESDSSVEEVTVMESTSTAHEAKRGGRFSFEDIDLGAVDDDEFDYDADCQPLVDASEDLLLATVLKRCHGLVVCAHHYYRSIH